MFGYSKYELPVLSLDSIRAISCKPSTWSTDVRIRIPAADELFE